MEASLTVKPHLRATPRTNLIRPAQQQNPISYTPPISERESPILKEMQEKGQIKTVGAFYLLTDGT
jgi:hypothetical protein